MAMLFIALQCCQCSTMQVKQQKKGGSKWVCAVCNQQQSVRRVHARGPLARDIRKFVQDFNMARAGITSYGPDPVFPPSDGSDASSDSGISSCASPSSAKKRMDWSVYLDPLDDEEDQDGSMDDGGATELPKKRRIESSNRSNRKSRLGMKPAFAMREKLPSGGDGDEADCVAGSGKRMQQGKGGSSTKWSEYLEGGSAESHQPGGGGPLPHDDPERCCYHHDANASSREAAVEEEVHPDFM